MTWRGAAAWRQELKCASTQRRLCRLCHLDQAYHTIINELASQPALHQVSLSYGLGETYMAAGQMETDDQYFAALAGAGVTVFVSSGDGGSSPGPTGHDNSGPVQVESPASDPNVNSVGGTSLYLDTFTGAVSSESAWFDGGGGVSTVFRPTGLAKWGGRTCVQSRLVPDVALVADQRPAGSLSMGGKCTWLAARAGARRPGQVLFDD